MKQSSNNKSHNGSHRSFFNNRRNNNFSIPSRNTVLDSSGPCGRIRGTAIQLSEKYTAAARDLRHNDSITSEICLQYADYYQRLHNLACAEERSTPIVTPVGNTAQNVIISSSATLGKQDIPAETFPIQTQEKLVNSSNTFPKDLPFMTSELPVEVPKKKEFSLRRTKKEPKKLLNIENTVAS